METVDKQQYFVPDPEKQTLKLIERNDDDQFELELLERHQISPDTFRVVFKLPNPDHVMGLPVGGHLFFHIEEDGEVYSRKYTPTSVVNERGKIEFVIKAYYPNDEFPKGGKVSVYLANMKLGDKIKMEGPKGLLFYYGNGNFELRKKPLRKTSIGLIAGGTGITPCYQLIQASSLAKDGLEIVLLYSNKTKDDILVKEDLDRFAAGNSDNLTVYHTLTRHSDEKHGAWDGFKGRITKQMLEACGFPKPGADTLIGYCGPAGFNKTVEELLAAMGYTKDMMYKF